MICLFVNSFPSLMVLVLHRNNGEVSWSQLLTQNYMLQGLMANKY